MYVGVVLIKLNLSVPVFEDNKMATLFAI